jgi:hypothetical protein
LFLNPQTLENVILFVTAFWGLYLLRGIHDSLHIISVALRLSLKPADPLVGPLPVSERERRALIDPTVEGRYARITFPESMRPFKDA